MEFDKRVIVSGGAGFIGSHLIKFLCNKYQNYQIINIDNLTYAGNLSNLKSIEDSPNYCFEKSDITDYYNISAIFEKYDCTDVIHLAAESHVDRSISNPIQFVKTNVMGTVSLLNAAKNYWSTDYADHVFYHVSTDEVYGSLGEEGLFEETTPYDPRSPYSASKASSDHFVRAYYHTYGLPIVISNCSNNYGPYQFPEKLIPLMINNILKRRNLPVYGDGLNVRDWLWVGDHVNAIDNIFHNGKLGETYNVGGNNESTNLNLVKELCDIVDELSGSKNSTSLISFVEDRKGHDRRYAIDASKLMNELGWSTTVGLSDGLKKTVKWYLDNLDWMENVTSGDYRKYYEENYLNR